MLSPASPCLGQGGRARAVSHNCTVKKKKKDHRSFTEFGYIGNSLMSIFVF